MKSIIKIISTARRFVIPKIKPSKSYFLGTRTIEPISAKFGFDRGNPIDRFWIEDFLTKNRGFISGRVLEVTDNAYTKKFGGSNVSQSDVLDINVKNKKANVYGDIRDLHKAIPNNTYDTIILTQVLGMIDDLHAAVYECHRILKPGGTILVTSSSLSPTLEPQYSFWRFTKQSMKYLFSKHFTNLEVASYGNALAGQCFWVGMAQEEMKPSELLYIDPRFECLVTVRATK